MIHNLGKRRRLLLFIRVRSLLSTWVTSLAYSAMSIKVHRIPKHTQILTNLALTGVLWYCGCYVKLEPKIYIYKITKKPVSYFISFKQITLAFHWCWALASEYSHSPTVSLNTLHENLPLSAFLHSFPPSKGSRGERSSHLLHKKQVPHQKRRPRKYPIQKNTKKGMNLYIQQLGFAGGHPPNY